jgi:hypothetical protein
MIPQNLRALFWDCNSESFDPASHPDYTIARVLEHGDRPAVTWLKEMFSEDEIRRVLGTDGRLSPKSATFWALVYRIPGDEVAALTAPRARLDR